jgi:retron-type reverse transcriptase
LDANLAALRSELLAGRLNWGDYHMFKIHDPKPRDIHAPPFRDRVAHHAVMSLCEPAFETYQIDDSFACRKNKGLDAALHRALKFCRAGGWHLKLDVHKYFDSIDHIVLKRLLRRRFKDGLVIQILESIIDTYQTAPGKGIPIGNLTSQFFANHYLAPLDRHIKERLRVRRYVRYMDDFVLWTDSRQTLKSVRSEIEGFLTDPLRLSAKPPCLNHTDRGLTFLGYKVYPAGLRLAGRSRQRFRRKARLYQQLFDSGIWDEAETARHIEPLIAFVRRGASRAFRQRVFFDMEDSKGRRPEARTG